MNRKIDRKAFSEQPNAKLSNDTSKNYQSSRKLQKQQNGKQQREEENWGKTTKGKVKKAQQKI